MKWPLKRNVGRNPSSGAPGAGILSDLNVQNVSSGLISATLICTGPAIVLLEAAAAGNLSDRQTIGWMFACYFLGGLFGVVMSLWHRKPFVGGHSLTGVAFLATVAAQFPYSQLIGAFVMSGLLIFLVGISGILTTVMKWVPRQVIAAMLAGLVAGYVVRLVPAAKELPLVGGLAVLSYFVCMKFTRRIPPALVAVVVAVLATLATQRLEFPGTDLPFMLPMLQQPEFTFTALVSVAVPLALLILSNDIALGIGALIGENFDPPVRRLVIMSGVFSMAAGILGGQSANVAGMASAICAGQESGPKASRYMASLVSSVVTLAFGVLAWKVVPFVKSLPPALFAMLGAFALIGVLLSNLKEAFADNGHAISALTAFVVALSNVSFLQISAPVWAILSGIAVNWFMKIGISSKKG